MVINRVGKLACLAAVVMILTGCGHPSETGYHDFNKVQLQFYAPQGATVMLGQECLGGIAADRSHQINNYGSPAYRLEHQPEETATFNLAPGQYEFKYTGAPGWEGASVYGNIDVYNVCPLLSPGAKMMIRKGFIPIALPSPGTSKNVTASDDTFPYTSPSHRLRISYQDVDRIMAGDTVTKVIFVADLKKAQQEVNELEVNYALLQGKQLRLRALLNEAQLDALENPKAKKFIELQGKLTEIQQKIDLNRDRSARLQALLRADNVLIRREMMVLATDEILPAHEDPVAAAKRLGQVVVVMRLGGRHLHWGNPAKEAAVFNK
ncbi:MAG: hypothetical protein WC975_07900 [Phycisphaerae bacterium]